MNIQEKAPRICVGAFSSAHGIKGWVKLKSLTEQPEAVFEFPELYSESGKPYKIKLQGRAGEFLLASVEGVADRNAAEQLRQVKLYVPFMQLPLLEEETFYVASLVGMVVKIADGSEIGTVTNIYNFGAGDIVAIKENNSNEELLYSFTRETFPEINETHGYVVLQKPEEI